MEINIIWVAISAFLGAIATALVGFIEQEAPWDWKKFIPSIIRSLIAGVAIAAATDYSGATSGIIYLIAFLSGAGVEVGGNRVAGAIAARMNK